MGVSGLESFVKTQVPNGYVTVNILEEIDEFKSRDDGCLKPAIIFDVMGFIHSLGGCDVELLCGGRHNVYLQNVRTLFKTLTEHGAELIFICDGQLRTDNLSKWIYRRRREYDECLRIYDAIDNGQYVDTGFNGNARCCKSVVNSILFYANEFGEIVISTKRDCDAVIAKYAYEKNALAVIATDTDFLIFPGQWNYWHALNFDYERLTIKQFNRNGLMKYLHLPREAMPFFATIVGNDFKQEIRILKQFGGPKNERFLKIADYVRDISRRKYESDVEFYRALAISLFDSKLSGLILKDKMEQLKFSVESYKIDFEADCERKSVVRKYAEANVFMNAVMSEGMFQYDMNFVDLRNVNNNNANVSFPEILLTVFQKLSGIILYDFPTQKWTIITKPAIDLPYKERTVNSILPTENIPTLKVLISKYHEIDDTRWNLLMWALSLDEKFQFQLKEIPEKFFMIVLAVTFLLKNHQVTLKEADALVAAEYSVKQNLCNDTDIRKPEILNGRAVRIAQIYNKAMCLVWDCLYICGLTNLIVPFEFDGFYFHNLIEQHELSPESYFDSVKAISNVRIYTD